MKNLHLSIRFAFAFALLLICCFTTQAQQRVFVAGTGDDLNLCTRTSPCRNFQRGHDAVAPGGEVVALDSAGYGVVTITKSVSIIGDGVYAGITTSSGTGVTIATAGITVTLRSLTIEGLGGGMNGINATDFTALHVENCIVNRFFFGTQAVTPASGTRRVFIKDCISRNNVNVGINLVTAGGTLLATIEGTRAENNDSRGISVSGSALIVTARDCQVSGNDGGGFSANSGGVLNIESSVVSNNGTFGIASTTLATVRVSTSTVTDNTGVGFSNSGSTFESRENNTVAGNNGGGAQTSGTITTLMAL